MISWSAHWAPAQSDWMRYAFHNTEALIPHKRNQGF